MTIDEDEVHHLGMLLGHVFPEATQQLVIIVIIVISAPGQARRQELGRVDEYAFFLFLGAAVPTPTRDDVLNDRPSGNPDVIRCESLLRSGMNSRRANRPALFYPILIDPESPSLIEIGEAQSPDSPRSAWKVPAGAVAPWPLKSNGAEENWRGSRVRCAPCWLTATIGSANTAPNLAGAASGTSGALTDRKSNRATSR